VEDLDAKRRRLSCEPWRPLESLAARQVRHEKILFALQDRHLNAAASGPLHLRDERAAKVVVDAIHFGATDRYDLYAYVVMANHVHVLLTPRSPLERVMQGIKGFTSREINKLLGTTGRPLWQDESYDHWARDEDEMLRIIEYIELNPVKAGLCARSEDWPWSSAARRSGRRIGQPLWLETSVREQRSRV
jgi:REP element-mobilizing transposase RayT